ncbi:MAG: transposase, partial [Desulfobacteraceae bacterium]|nr:transposase [Desulfobacteraceae bacterium]
MKRQCIEAGFRELKNHYHLERLPFKGLRANEFWIMCKIMAMTLFKIF